ncbi:MAG: hypothetical protein V3T05_11540 [Myxococcota bacterium]
MTVGRWLAASRAELNTFAHRSRYLLDALERPGLSIRWTQRGDITAIEAVASEHAAWAIRNITVTGDCTGRFALHADVNMNGSFEPAIDTRISAGDFGNSTEVRRFNRLLSGMRLTVRPDPSPKHGAVLSERTARAYRFFLLPTTDGCGAKRVVLELDNLITGASSRYDLTDTGAVVSVPAARAEVRDVPTFRAGEESPHPWAFEPEPQPEVVRLGPGRVDIAETRIFAAHQTVLIAAGTQLALGPQVSLIFLGPLHATGTRAAPIQIHAADPKAPFGGLALIGPATAGSRVAHLYIEGGTTAAFRALDISALLTIYDTRDIHVEHVSISGGILGLDAEDIIRATYVDGLRLREVTIHRAPVDAIDIEMSDVEIQGARIVSPGDECLDLMGSRVRITDSLLVGCRNNAISAGEESDVSVHGVVVADSDVGVLAKNGSRVRISRSLIYRTRQALRTNKREVHYDAPSTIGAQDLFAVDCDRVTRTAKQTRIETGPVHLSLPEDGVLSHVRRQVLSLSRWDELDGRLAQLTGGEQL